MSQFHDLYAKVLSDSDFRKQLISDPPVALQSVGITPTPEILAALQNVIDSVSALGDDLGLDPTNSLGQSCVS